MQTSLVLCLLEVFHDDIGLGWDVLWIPKGVRIELHQLLLHLQSGLHVRTRLLVWEDFSIPHRYSPFDVFIWRTNCRIVERKKLIFPLNQHYSLRLHFMRLLHFLKTRKLLWVYLLDREPKLFLSPIIILHQTARNILRCTPPPLANLRRQHSFLTRGTTVVLCDQLPTRNDFGEMRAIDEHLLDLLGDQIPLLASGNWVTDAKDSGMCEPISGDQDSFFYELFNPFDF